MRVEPEAPFGEGTEPIIVKRSYGRKLAITFAVLGGIAVFIAFVIAAIYGGYWVADRLGGSERAGSVGACIVVVILFGFAIAGSDWDSEDGY